MRASHPIPPTLGAGEVGITVWVSPTIDLKLYGVTGPYLRVGPFLGFEHNTGASWVFAGGVKAAYPSSATLLSSLMPRTSCGRLWRSRPAIRFGPVAGP